MQPLGYFAFTFLCSLFFLSPVPTMQCNGKQFPWPVGKPTMCCDKCPPGNRMLRRTNCGTECAPCTGERYIETYNVQMSCNVCKNCDKPNMEYKSVCNHSRNAVCRCKADYRCKDQPCTACVPIPSTTTRPILTPSTTALTTGAVTTPPNQIKETVWFLVIIALLCAVFAFVVVTKIKPFLRWIRSEQDYFLPEKRAPVPTCSVDEEVSTPVQEVCGKCDQPIDVCVKDSSLNLD